MIPYHLPWSSFDEKTYPSANVNLLRKILGKKLINLTRHGWGAKDKATTWWLEEGYEADSGYAVINCNEVFAFTEGALSLEFDEGVIIGASNNPSLHSVVVWLDDYPNSAEDRSVLYRESGAYGKEVADLIPVPCVRYDSSSDILCTDGIYSTSFFSSFIGDVLENCFILKDETYSASWLPCEVGLEFVFSSGRSFIWGSYFYSRGNGSESFVLNTNELELHIMQNITKTSIT